MFRIFICLSAVAVLLAAGCGGEREQRTEQTQPRSNAVPQRGADPLPAPSPSEQYPRQTATVTAETPIETSSETSAPTSLPTAEQPAAFLQSEEGQAELASLPDDLAVRIEQIVTTEIGDGICDEPDEACIQVADDLCREASEISVLLGDTTAKAPQITARMGVWEKFYCNYGRFLPVAASFAERCETSNAGTPSECSGYSAVLCESGTALAEAIEEASEIDPDPLYGDAVEGFREAATLICAAYLILALEAEDTESEQTVTSQPSN